MKLIAIGFSFIFISQLAKQILASDCPKNCNQCNESGSCSECVTNYRLDQNTFTCYASCGFGQSYDSQSDSCLSICPSSYYSDSQTKSCQQMLPCPTMSKQGQNYFDVFLNMVSTSSGKILVQGMVGGLFSQSIIILDNQNYQPSGKLIGHDNGVVAMHYLTVNSISDLGNTNFQPTLQPQGQEILISVSRTQLIIWNLKFNQIIYKIILPNSLIGQYKLTQINQNYIILMQNKDILNNFAIVYLSDIVKQPIYQQISTPTLINSSYKLFKDAHIQSISGILITSNNLLISYGEDNKLVFWNDTNDPNNFSYKCSLSNSIDQLLYLTNTAYLIQISNDYSLYIYNGLECVEVQSYHSSLIQQILTSPSTIASNIIYFFSFSIREIIFYIYDAKQNTFSYIFQVNQDNQYRFISNNYLILISSQGNVSVNSFDDNLGITQIFTFKLYFTQLNPVNQVLIKNSNLLILYSELSIFQLTPLPSDSKQLPVELKITDKKKNIKNKMKYHTEAVNGILFDRLYDRVITYSVDGSFKVWEERVLENLGNITDYRLIIEQFHPSCNMLQQQNCQIQMTDMMIATPTLFACLYNDNKVILWNYNPFNVTLNATLSLDLSTLSINNMYVYSNNFISINNSRQLKVYNFVTMTYTQVIYDSFYYAVLENNNGVDCAYFIRSNTTDVIIMNLQTRAILMTNSYAGTIGFAKYYPEIKILFFSSITSNILYYYPFLFVNVRRFSIAQPVAISVDIVTRNFMVFQQNYNVAYYYWSGTSLFNYGVYTFSASVPLKLAAPLSNPEQHFFVQNTAFPAIQNQVISFSYQYDNQMLLTFSDKISSIALDPISRKLYLGFENGNVYSGGYSTNYYAYMDPSNRFNGIYYNQNDRSVYAFNTNIHQIATTNMTKPKTYSGAHKSTINDIIIDTQNNWIVSYSNDTTNNFFRWDMNETSGTVFNQFKGSQTQNVIKAFLDVDADRIISYSTDKTFIVWQYSNLTLLYVIDTHIQEQKKYNDSISSIPLDQQIPYQVVSIYHDPINKRIISINNNQGLFIHYYSNLPNANPPILQNTLVSYVIPNMVDLYIDFDPYYAKFYAKILNNMVYSLQTYNFQTFTLEQTLSYHTQNIQGMKFINTKSYSYQFTLLVIMDRKTQQFILSILTQNPLITNFIVFEKMDHIYLFSEWYKDILSYRLAVHRLSTGVLIKQILNSQYIENGNINMVFLDEDRYQLLIYKSLLLNIFAVDVRTFSYTNYFTYKYVPPLKKVIFIQEHNLMCHIDAYYLEIYQMDYSFNTDKIALNMVQQKQPSYFYSENSKMLYYIDVDNNAWQFNTQSQQQKYVQNLNLVRQTKLYNGFFYVITDQSIIQFGDISNNLQKLNQVNIVIKNAYFLDQFLFCETFQFQLLKLSYDPLVQVKTFNFQFTTKVKQIVSITNMKQIIVQLMNASILRIDVAADDLLQQYSSIPNLNIIDYDYVNRILIHHLETGAMIFYSDFSNTTDYMNNQARRIQITLSDPVYQMQFDYKYNRLFVLNVRKIIPKIRVFTYNVTYPNNTLTLDTPQLITIIPPPTKGQHLVMKIQNDEFIVQCYFQINIYTLDKLQLKQSIRDTTILQTLKSYEILQVEGQMYPYVTQFDSFSILLKDKISNNWKLVNQFYKSYPNLAFKGQVFDTNTNYFSTQIFGISNGDYFNYNFFIQNSSKNQLSKQLNQLKCYQELPPADTLDKIQEQLNQFQLTFQLLNLQMQQTLFQIEVIQKFYYDPDFASLNSQVVYSGSKTRAIMNVINDSFSSNKLNLVQVKNYDLDISQAQVINFNHETKIISFENIAFKNTGNNFQFQLSNLENMILENISISSLDLKGQSILFNISNSDTIYINNLLICNVKLFDDSYLIAFEKVNYVYINNLVLDQIEIISSQVNLNDLIIFKNVQKIYIEKSSFTNVSLNSQQSQQLYIIQSQSVYDFQLNTITVNNLSGISFSQVLNSYTKNPKTYFQFEGTFSLQNATFENITNLQSPLIQLKGNSYKLTLCSFKNITCNQCYGAAVQVIESQQFILNFTEFSLCFASNGGALSIQNSFYNNTSIQNSVFKNNQASLNGGAIFLDQTNLFMENTTIQYNKAQIGGGIRYLYIEPVFIFLMKQSQKSDDSLQRRNLDSTQNIISMNQATIHSNNYGSYISNIKILKSSVSYKDLTESASLPDSVKNDQLNLQTCFVSEFQSGTFFDFQFQLLDDEGNPLSFDPDLVKKDLYPPSIQNEIILFNIRVDTNSPDIKIFGQYITDYLNFNSTSKSFIIQNMQVIANPQTQNIFHIESESILKVTNPTSQNREIKSGPFHITFIVDFRKCIIGELYRLQGSIFYCQECLDETYSIIEPDKEKYLDQQCLRCPDKALHCFRNQMTLKPGFWKSANLTDSIVECSNKLSNCVGTEIEGYCLKGHIGPLCEQCDISGQFWPEKYYSDGSFGCKKCSQLLKPANLVPTIFVALGMVVYVLISIRIAWDISELIVIGFYLRKIKFAPISKSSFLDTTNMNMKAMMSYVQISQLVNTIKVDLPSWLTFFPEYVGNPVQNMIYFLDCYLVDVNQKDIPIVFMRIVWGLSIPFFYLLGMSIIYFIFVQFKFMRHNIELWLMLTKIQKRNFQSYYFYLKANKLVIALIVLILYLVVLVKFTPYQMIYFQSTDRNSTIVIIILVLMNIFLYNKPDLVQSQIFYIILLGIHSSYLAFLFFEVLKAKIQISFKKQFDKIKLKLSQYCHCLRPYLTIQKNIQLKTFFNWKKVKNLIHNLRTEKEKGIIRDKIFGLSSQVVSSQSNIQSPFIKSSEKLIAQEYAKSKFHDKLFNQQNKLEDSIKSFQLENSVNNFGIVQKKEKVLDKLESPCQVSLQINNNNINQISISINNQTVFLGSPLVNNAKDEVNDSQFKLSNQGNPTNANNQNLSPLLSNQNIEQMVMQNLNLTNSNQTIREGIISKNLKRVTQSTNITISNVQTQQIILNQQNNQSIFNEQSWQQVQNQIFDNVDQSKSVGNLNFLFESPLIIAKNVPKDTFQDAVNNQEGQQTKQIDELANTNIIDTDNDSNNISKFKDSIPQYMEISTQGNYFKKENESTNEINGSHKKQLNLIKIEQHDEVNEKNLVNQSISNAKNIKSQDFPQIQHQITPEYQDYFEQYQNYLIQNEPYSELNQPQELEENQKINQNDIKIELQEIAFSKEESNSTNDQEAKKINSSQNSNSKIERKQEEENQVQNIVDFWASNKIETPKNFFDIELSEDSFEFQKQQTGQNKITSKSKPIPFLNKNFTKTFTKDQFTVQGTLIMDHQTIYTVDQDRIKSQGFNKGLEQQKSGNSNTGFSQKIDNQQLNYEQELTNNQTNHNTNGIKSESQKGFSFVQPLQSGQKEEKEEQTIKNDESSDKNEIY